MHMCIYIVPFCIQGRNEIHIQLIFRYFGTNILSLAFSFGITAVLQY